MRSLHVLLWNVGSHEKIGPSKLIDNDALINRNLASLFKNLHIYIWGDSLHQWNRWTAFIPLTWAESLASRVPIVTAEKPVKAQVSSLIRHELLVWTMICLARLPCQLFPQRAPRLLFLHWTLHMTDSLRWTAPVALLSVLFKEKNKTQTEEILRGGVLVPFRFKVW